MIKPSVTPKVRCAVYTRKSTEEGLDMEFNSLDAQRESCEAYITSQKGEGWYLVPDRYDDGGFSGGNLDRPALKRLMADIEAGKVNVVVVYKIDRLTRSLMDFGKLVTVFEQHGVTFVSVTQSFNTTTSMGRLTLNILLSFSQFERELSAERIRDKISASKRKGMWMGGYVPLGYRVDSRKLVIVPEEAATIRSLFQRFLEIGSATELVQELAEAGVVGRSGKPISKGLLYRMFANRLYVGEIAIGKDSVPGEHEAIIDRELWDRVHAALQSNTQKRAPRSNRLQTPALLRGIIHCRHCGRAMSPSFTRKEGRLYRYYVCQTSIKTSYAACPLRTVAAGEIETVVLRQVRNMIQSPELVVKTWRNDDGVSEQEVIEALKRLDPVWEELFPVEQQRLVQLLIAKVDVAKDGVQVHLRSAGLGTLARELRDIGNNREVAA
ncbi:MAG: recombinase family protein [Magnetococcales bacterium]|nr:recombinase family protein [Magnetococcales bacterium]